MKITALEFLEKEPGHSCVVFAYEIVDLKENIIKSAYKHRHLEN